MTNFILFGIPSTKFSRIDGSMLCHANFSFWISNSTVLTCPISSSRALRIDHRFSMGFKSGEFPGHSPLRQNCGKLFSSHCCVNLAVCAVHHPAWIKIWHVIQHNSLCYPTCLTTTLNCIKASYWQNVVSIVFSIGRPVLGYNVHQHFWDPCIIASDR